MPYLLKLAAFALVILPIFRASAVEPNLESPDKLEQLWWNEEIYFKPKNKADLMNWSGVIYHYGSKRCYELEQDGPSKPVTSRESKCQTDFLEKAKEPYTKIADFGEFERRLSKCLSESDRKCLRGLISKSLKVSLGVDGFQDRRDYIFETWKKEDFERLRHQIKKGSRLDGEARVFPAKDRDGYQGRFEKMNGGWLLREFVSSTL